MSFIRSKLNQFLDILAWSFASRVAAFNSSSVVNEVRKRATIDSSNYAIQNMKSAMLFDSREDLWSYCLESVRQGNSEFFGSAVLEFGVWKGDSINFFAKSLPNFSFYGFDSFEGLEEDWSGRSRPKGSFDLQGILPKVAKNVTLIKGWVQDTLPSFLNELGSEKVRMIHLDLDTYTPTKFVLDLIAPIIGKGTILIFDEYFGYPSWQEHEFRAWKEFTQKYSVKYEYIAYSDMQVAVEIK